MLAEWHLYASGPNNDTESAKFWDGDTEGKQNVQDAIKPATDWTTSTGINTCLLAWMPVDNIDMTLDQDEARHFGRYFVKKLKEECEYSNTFN